MFHVLNKADLTDEELMTAMVGAEGLLNSRPIAYQSSNADDAEPLTPNHFLFNQVGGQFAPESVDTEPFNLRNRWRRVQEVVRHFWKRWLQEWLPSFSSRKKWRKEKQDLKVHDCCYVFGIPVRDFPGALAGGISPRGSAMFRGLFEFDIDTGLFLDVN